MRLAAVVSVMLVGLIVIARNTAEGGEPPVVDELSLVSPTDLRSKSKTSHNYGLLRILNNESSRVNLEVRWFVLQKKTKIEIKDVRSVGQVEDIYGTAPCKRPQLVTSGAFYGFDKDGERIPLGLVISNGRELSPFQEWSSGGILATYGSSVTIIPVRDYHLARKPVNAIQSKPILVLDYQNAINSGKPPLANRISIGKISSGQLIVISVTGAHGLGVDLMEFAQIVAALPKFGGPAVQVALSLDGGPGVHIFDPKSNVHVGEAGEIYVPNLICFE